MTRIMFYCDRSLLEQPFSVVDVSHKHIVLITCDNESEQGAFRQINLADFYAGFLSFTTLESRAPTRPTMWML